MYKKFLLSLSGVGSVFGFSIKNHLFSNGSENRFKKLIPKTDFSFQTVSRESDLKELETIEPEIEDRSLDRSHFGSWRFQSEGGNDSIYLVKKNNSIIQVKASNHGQKKRFLKDGILIDKNNKWFGYRDITKQFKEKKEESHKEMIQRYKNMIRASFNEDELRLLGEWWKKKAEYEQCEILEIMVECDTIRKSLGKKTITWIDDGLKLNPAHLITLAKMTNTSFPKLQEIIGSGKLIHLPERGEVGYLAGEVINTWISDYIEKKHIEKEKQGEVNLISLLEKLFFGKQAYKACNKKEEDTLKIYEECTKAIKKIRERSSKKKGEKTLTPKIKGVVKAAKTGRGNSIQVANSNNNHSYARSLKTSWSDIKSTNGNQESKKISGNLKSKGRDKGLIDIECEKEAGSAWSFLTSWSLSTFGKQKGCQIAWELIFKGDVSDKRLCLFQIPAAKYYLREYKVSFLTLSNWYKNNKFWAKCSEYSL